MGTFSMPSLGADMEAGTLVEWLKKPGETVQRGDIIAVVETDKGAIEVEVFEDGKIAQLLVQPGEKVPVGTPLARIASDEDLPPTEEPAVPAAPVQAAAREPVAQPVMPPVAPPVVPPATPAPLLPVGEVLRASPAARDLAREKNIDLASVAGSGPDGAIVRDDVEQAEAGSPLVRETVADLDPMRRAIAAAMSRSKRDIPHYYLAHSFDVTAAAAWLGRYNANHPPAERLLMGALTVKAAALALREFPEFNGFYGTGGFTPSSAIHMGMAIAMRGGGLAAPAIHHTDSIALPELMVQMRDLVSRVRKGGFRSSEVSDPTVTVSSLGDRGVDMLLPIIYPPQVAIIGFGSVSQHAWPVGDALAVRPVMTATIGADHRANDGHRGALLLRRIAELLNRPEGL